MKKKFALLLAGTMTLSLLLSACKSSTGAPTAAPDPSSPSSPSPAAPASSLPAETVQPSQEGKAESPSEAPSQEADTAQPAAPSAQVSTPEPQPTKAPAVRTPAPVKSTPAPTVSTPTPLPPAEATQPTSDTVLEPTPAPVIEPVPTPAPAVSPREVAVSYIGQSVSSLIAAIGQPSGRDYAPSCLGSGEDGELFYNGFTVYTYREGSVEIVQDVV